MNKIHITTQIKQELESLGLRPNKRLGQNFLINTAIYEKIVKAVDPKERDIIVEVGPGLGTLTEHLAQTGATIIAVEKDKNLISYLQQKFIDTKNVSIVQNDILKWDPSKHGLKAGTYKLVGNIPYYLTSRLLRIVFDAWPSPKRIVVMVQREVAKKIAAKPPDTTLLSIAMQYYSNPSIMNIVSRGNFYPEPDVDSAIVRLEPHKNTKKHPGEKEKFFKILKAGFSQKRKKLINTLSGGLDTPKESILESLKKAKIDPENRPERLTLEEWKTLSKVINTHS